MKEDSKSYLDHHGGVGTGDATSVTRFGDLLDFGQVFKAFGNNYLAQNAHIHRQFL